MRLLRVNAAAAIQAALDDQATMDVLAWLFDSVVRDEEQRANGWTRGRRPNR